MTRVRRSRAEARKMYNRFSRWYDLAAGFFEKKYTRAGLDMVQVSPGATILDIGSGTGQAVIWFSRRIEESGKVIGLDIAENMLAVTQNKVSRTEHSERVGLVCADAVRLPLHNQRIDSVFMSFTLELFDSPVIPEVLAECRRVLKPEGRINIVSLQKSRRPGLMERIYEWIHSRFPRYADCRPVYVKNLLQKEKFRILQIRRMNMFGLPVTAVRAEKAVPSGT